mmetsp:Transcript_19975/g.46870  ORF Transcript_19975/g.46870 Transcript_19975/m.46870 type:complete len:322 (+) Transcript_19975:47-1012(+)
MQGQDVVGEGMHNAVSILQEHVQSCSDFPPHARILMWNFENRIQEDSLLQFRAVVSFIFKEVPHFFRGSWQTSKKKAQRDTAERVRRYMSRNDSQSGLQAPQGPALTLDELVQQELCHMRDTRQTSRSWQGEHVDGEVEDRLSAVGQEFRMVLCFELNRVPHQFAGAWCTSVSDAVSDAAQRVLWYFGLGTGFQGTSLSTTAQAAEPLPPQLLSPKEIGTSPGASVGSEPRHPVEDKTILMQVQNMLQKTFSKDTAAGEKVWVWTYEPSPADPQVFRAIAQVPAIGRTFQGDWCRGKKFAQRNACLAVKAFLEEQGVSDVP